jgi:hypothetical protein
MLVQSNRQLSRVSTPRRRSAVPGPSEQVTLRDDGRWNVDLSDAGRLSREDLETQRTKAHRELAFGMSGFDRFGSREFD